MLRRDFLRHLLLGSSMPLTLLNVSASSGQDLPAMSGTIARRRLVLIELAGANDGLNTLVPYTNDHYHALRPTLGLGREEILTLDQEFGLHSALLPLMRHWERGELAWVQGLGYPQANRSHFKSLYLWETAGDGRTAGASQGWMTHAVEHQLPPLAGDPHGISLVSDMDLFASETGRWLSLGGMDLLAAEHLPKPASDQQAHPALQLLQSRLQTLEDTLNTLSSKLAHAPEIESFEAGSFGAQLRQVATLIAAGVQTPVFRVRLDGFDTHQDQSGVHADLLATLALGLDSFARVLESMGEWQQTLIMSYSEFGRRAAENHSGGTDHGTAAPHLVMGGAVNGGLYGSAPDLDDLPDGDPLYTMDYRALYQCMLADGLGCQGALATLDSFRDARIQALCRHS